MGAWEAAGLVGLVAGLSQWEGAGWAVVDHQGCLWGGREQEEKEGQLRDPAKVVGARTQNLGGPRTLTPPSLERSIPCGRYTEDKGPAVRHHQGTLILICIAHPQSPLWVWVTAPEASTSPQGHALRMPPAIEKAQRDRAGPWCLMSPNSGLVTGAQGGGSCQGPNRVGISSPWEVLELRP